MNILSSKNELSNNYKLEMEIDNKKWKNVSHYVYSNMLNYATHKNILKNNLKDISKNFHELADTEEEELIVEALSTALPIKFSNIEMGRKLISTGDVPIVYRSSNQKLGVDEKGEGKNIYGKLLMKIRKTLREKMNLGYKAQIDNDSKEVVYRSYLIKYLLEDYMNRGMDIRMFLNMDIDSIYNLVAGDYNQNVPVEIYNSFQNYKKSLDRLQRDIVLGFVEPQLRSNPERVVQFVLKNKLRNMQLTLKQRKKRIIYNEYLEDFLLKKNLNNDKVKFAFDSYSELILNRERFENYLEQAYDKGVLPKTLSSSISDRLKNIRIPTDEEVEEAESVVFNVIEKPQAQQQVQPQVQQQAPPSTDKPKNNTDRFLDSLFNPPKRNQNQPQNQPQNQDTKETETHIRPNRRYQQPPTQSPTQPQAPSSLEENTRAILDAILNGQPIPEDLLKKHVEKPNSLIIDSRVLSIYIDLCPVFLDNLWIADKNENKKLFPSVSHYLMYCIIRNASGNMNQAYSMMFLNAMQFAPLDVINYRYREILISKYDYFLRRAIDVKMKNPEIVQALADTGNVQLYYNDKYDYILGTGKEKNGNNLTGLYLMALRNNLNTDRTKPVKQLSQLELFVQNEDVWVEERVKEYCNSILNYGNISDDNLLIQVMDKLYPCPFQYQLGSYEVPNYFTKMVKEENSNLNSNIILYIWNKILSICNYVLLHCKDHSVPNPMLQKASLIVQNQAFSKNKDRNTAIENALINIANKIREVENQPKLLIGYAKIATNILLKRRITGDIQIDISDNDSDSDDNSQGTVDYGDDGSEDGDRDRDNDNDIYGEEDAPKRISSNTDDNNNDNNDMTLTTAIVKKHVKEIENNDLPENIKQGRINYFQLI